MTKIKICGITTYKDALFAAEMGADMLGFNFFKRSPRYITPDAALAICDPLRAELGKACPLLVGVFVNEVVGNISAVTIKVGLDAAQLSGDESDAMLLELRGIAFKAIKPPNEALALDDVDYYLQTFPNNERMPSLLVDAYHPQLQGGTGIQVSHDIAVAVKEKVPRMMLAGGLSPDNVAEYVSAIEPWGVDVASGVEQEGQPGIKDHAMIKTFIEAVQFA